MAVDGHVFDMGIQTSLALQNLKNGMSPETAGPSDEWSNGNGSLVRSLPLALWHRGTDEELVAHAQVCCALYVLVARLLLGGQTMSDVGDGAQEALAMIYCGSQFALALQFVLSAKSN